MTRSMELYLQAFEGWPDTLAALARPIVDAHARQAYTDIRAGYPVKTGTLRDGLTIQDTSKGAMHPSMTVANDTVYAKIFEMSGATTAGPKPAGRVFLPITIRERRAMRAEIFALIDRTAPRG